MCKYHFLAIVGTSDSQNLVSKFQDQTPPTPHLSQLFPAPPLLLDPRDCEECVPPKSPRRPPFGGCGMTGVSLLRLFSQRKQASAFLLVNWSRPHKRSPSPPLPPCTAISPTFGPQLLSINTSLQAQLIETTWRNCWFQLNQECAYTTVKTGHPSTVKLLQWYSYTFECIGSRRLHGSKTKTLGIWQ